MKILELPFPFTTPANLEIPFRDEFGIPHGEAYEAFKTARDAKISTRSTFSGLKFKRRFEALSMNEQRPLFGFAFNPYVVDIRDQYPIYDSDNFSKAVRLGRRMRKNEVMTIDIVLTIVSQTRELHYHGISIKDSSAVLSDADERRHQREQGALQERGWTWELLRGLQFSKLAFSNHFVMYRCVRDSDVFSKYEDAKWFAGELTRSSQSGTFGSMLGRVSKRLGIGDAIAHQLFAVAVAFGFLTLDHTKPLRVDQPLYLLHN